MSAYRPKFTITNNMLDYINIIMEKVEELDNYNDFNKKEIFKKNNRIRSIHATLALDSSTFSPEEVKSIIERKYILIKEKDLLEIKNIYNAYEIINRYEQYELKDLKRIHKIMTDSLSARAGKFRIKSEIEEDEFFLSYAEKLSTIMHFLFDFLKEKRNEIHPLILSSIAHYEIITIKPFKEENEKAARLWQTVMLFNWEEIFAHVPIEMQLKKYEKYYYETINKCQETGDSTLFIEFMLKIINRILTNLIRYKNKQQEKQQNQEKHDIITKKAKIKWKK